MSTDRSGYEEHLHRTADGVRIHYRDYVATGAAKTPVVCLHGLTRNERDFEDVAPLIAASGRRVITPSMRGRGPSEWDPDPTRYHPGTYAADVAGLLDALGVPHAVFVGTSLGGIVAMVLAATAPDRVAACVLNDIGAVIELEGLTRIRKYVGRSSPSASWEEAAERVRAMNGVSFPNETDPAFWLAFARRVGRETPDGIVSDYDPAVAQLVNAGDPSAPPEPLWPVFDALAQTPTLLVRGALSDLLSAETVAAMRERKPDLRVVEEPDVGHAPFLTEPASRTALLAFLAELD